MFDLQALLVTDCVDIIALTETWLDDNFLDSELHLNDYNIFRRDRSNRRGGGVLLAIKDQISSIQRTDLETESEMLALEILLVVFFSRCFTDLRMQMNHSWLILDISWINIQAKA